jgi:aspartyl protease family protein
MDTTSPARRRWTLITTAASLLAISGLVDTAAAQMPSIHYPGGSASGGETSSRQGRNGMFVFETTVNGTALPMMFDTGASWVSLRAEDAEKAGINVNALGYTLHTSTANGIAEVAPVTLSTLTVGGITRHDVKALVHKPGALGANLMGQTFLSRLAGFRREGDHIVLQDQ